MLTSSLYFTRFAAGTLLLLSACTDSDSAPVQYDAGGGDPTPTDTSSATDATSTDDEGESDGTSTADETSDTAGTSEPSGADAAATAGEDTSATTTALGDAAATSTLSDAGGTNSTSDTSVLDGSLPETSAPDAALDSDGGVNPLAAVELGSAGNFVILAKSGISSVPDSAITGDVGVSPAAGTFVTGFSLIADASNEYSTTPQVIGRVYAADDAPPTPTLLTTAVSDMELAFTDAAGRAADVTELGAGDISGGELTAGVYQWGTGLLIGDDVTLSGSATDIWIFQVAQDLTLSPGAAIVLSGGALPQNVFWQVAGLVQLGTGAHCEGIVLTQTSATLETGASLNGRLLAQTAVTLDSSTVVEPD